MGMVNSGQIVGGYCYGERGTTGTHFLSEGKYFSVMIKCNLFFKMIQEKCISICDSCVFNKLPVLLLPPWMLSLTDGLCLLKLVPFCSMRQKGQRQTAMERNREVTREERDWSTRHVTPGVLSHSSGELLLLPSARSKCGAKMTRNICHD